MEATTTDAQMIESLSHWLQSELGFSVKSIERQARQRPAWFIEAAGKDGPVSLYARGERPQQNEAFGLENEMAIQQQLEKNGITVPHIYGLCPSPKAVIMDQKQGTEVVSDLGVDEKRKLMFSYVEILAKMHAIDIEQFVAIGLKRPSNARDSVLGGLDRYTSVFREMKSKPEPFLEFVLKWLERNVPSDSSNPSIICWDAGQFLHHEGEITTLLDLELAHLGDPLEDLASIRMREPSFDFGNINEIYEHYAKVAGKPVDRDTIDYHCISFAMTNPISHFDALLNPSTETNYMVYKKWCNKTSMWALDLISQRQNIKLDHLPWPKEKKTPFAPAYRHLIEVINDLPKRDEFEEYKVGSISRLAEHLKRADEIGEEMSAGNIEDLQKFFGVPVLSWEGGEELLENFILEAGPESDADIVGLLYRRLERELFLLSIPGAFNAIQPTLQSIR